VIPARRVLLGIAAALVLAGWACRAPRSDAPAQRLVYVTHIGAVNGEIVIADTDGSNAHRLTSGFEPRISPDGRWVAFFRCFGCKPNTDVGRLDLHVVPSDGGKVRVLVKDTRTAEWAPDSKTILTEHAARLIAVTPVGERRTLAAGRYFRVDFSPDGQTIVVDRARTGNPACGYGADLFTLPAAGGRPRLLTRNGAFPVWRARSIAFARDADARCGVHTIWVVRPDGSGAHALVPHLPRNMSEAGHYGLSPVAWLSGGRRLLASIDDEFGNEAAVVDVRTGRLRRLGVPLDAVSRDGRWLVGQTGGAELPYSIVIARVTGGRPRTVAHGAVCCPDWNR
jgi:Tol biopolymer transport system component